MDMYGNQQMNQDPYMMGGGMYYPPHMGGEPYQMYQGYMPATVPTGMPIIVSFSSFENDATGKPIQVK